jgi:hypothetical protein
MPLNIFPKKIFENIFKGSYDRKEIFVKNHQVGRKKLKIIYKFIGHFKSPKV